jgi:uncharacterized RDD family membrane protein YckC
METPNLASFWRRFAAAFVDGIVTNIIFGLLTPFFGTRDKTSWGISLLVTWVYFCAFTIWKAQTPGKMLLGLKVVNENGGELLPATVVLRETVGKLLSSVVLGIGYLWVLWDPKKQAWHDKIAKTLVVRVS